MPDRPATPPASAALNRRNLLIGGALVATAAISHARKPVPIAPLLGKTKLETLIPNKIGPWNYETSSGLVLPPSDQLTESLYDQLITRVYTAADGTGVMMLIAYSGRQDGMLQVHRPEICYPASGYALDRIEDHAIRIDPGFALPTRFIVANSRARTEQLVYWTRIGPSFPTTWIGQREAVVKENLKGFIPDGVLVRISTIMQDDAGALALLERFTVDLRRSLAGKASQALFGTAA